MRSYSLSDAAVKDLNDICDYIALRNPRAASQLFDTIRQKCRLLAEFPSMGKAYEELAPRLRGIVVGTKLHCFVLSQGRWRRYCTHIQWLSRS
jgi:toxin ParE1/3/4